MPKTKKNPDNLKISPTLPLHASIPPPKSSIKNVRQKTCPRRPNFTPKQQAFIGHYIRTGNATEAAALSYNPSTRAVAGAIGGELLQLPKVVERIAKICERRGLTEDWAVRRLKKLGGLKKPILLKDEIYKVDDGPVQLDAAKTALKLHGHLSSTGIDARQDNRQINISIKTPDDLARLERIASIMSQSVTQQNVTQQSVSYQSGEIDQIGEIAP